MTERFNQGTVKVAFAQQQTRSHCNANLSASPHFMDNTQALIVQKMGGCRSIAHKRQTRDLSPLSRPLPKRS